MNLAKFTRLFQYFIPTFCPILSAVNAPTYNLEKFSNNLVKPIATDEYTIKDSFPFAKEVNEFDPNYVMTIILI